MTKNDAEVLINGKVYVLCGAEDSSYFQMIASYVNHKLGELRSQPGYSKQKEDYQQVLLMVNMADDYFKAKESADLLQQQKEENERDVYGIKHELINAQIKLEETQARIQELEEVLSEKDREITALAAKSTAETRARENAEASVQEITEAAAREAASAVAEELDKLNREIEELKAGQALEVQARKEAEEAAGKAREAVEEAARETAELNQAVAELKTRYAAEIAARKKAELNARYAAEAVETAARETAELNDEIEELRERYAKLKETVAASEELKEEPELGPESEEEGTVEVHIFEPEEDETAGVHEFDLEAEAERAEGISQEVKTEELPDKELTENPEEEAAGLSDEETVEFSEEEIEGPDEDLIEVLDEESIEDPDKDSIEVLDEESIEGPDEDLMEVLDEEGTESSDKESIEVLEEAANSDEQVRMSSDADSAEDAKQELQDGKSHELAAAPAESAKIPERDVPERLSGDSSTVPDKEQEEVSEEGTERTGTSDTDADSGLRSGTAQEKVSAKIPESGSEGNGEEPDGSEPLVQKASGLDEAELQFALEGEETVEVQLFEPENEADSGFQIVEVDTVEHDFSSAIEQEESSEGTREAAAAYMTASEEGASGNEKEEPEHEEEGPGEKAWPAALSEKERREKEEKEKQKALEAAKAATEKLLKSRGFKNLGYSGKRY